MKNNATRAELHQIIRGLMKERDQLEAKLKAAERELHTLRSFTKKL